MSRKANCIDNACVESFFSFLKSERKQLKEIKHIDEAKQIIPEYIDYYNQKRIQGFQVKKHLNNIQRRVKRQPTGLVFLLRILQTNSQNPGSLQKDGKDKRNQRGLIITDSFL
jgi:hypothetical protein